MVLCREDGELSSILRWRADRKLDSSISPTSQRSWRLASTGSGERINSSLYCRRWFTTASDPANGAQQQATNNRPVLGHAAVRSSQYVMVARILTGQAGLPQYSNVRRSARSINHLPARSFFAIRRSNMSGGLLLGSSGKLRLTT